MDLDLLSDPVAVRDHALVMAQEHYSMEDLLIPAPRSIAVSFQIEIIDYLLTSQLLAQLMLVATAQDFKLKESGQYKYVRYPGSFRACLVQVRLSAPFILANVEDRFQTVDTMHLLRLIKTCGTYQSMLHEFLSA